MENIPTKQEVKVKKRSSAYPAHTLEEAVEYLTKTYKALGKGPFSREDVSVAIGHPRLNGASQRKVACLCHFGLLQREGARYSISNLAEKILLPFSAEIKAEGLLESVKTPPLYSKLINRFMGQSLPTLLENILVRDYGILHAYSRGARKIFQESLTYAGLLKNGIILEHSDSNTSDDSMISTKNSVVASNRYEKEVNIEDRKSLKLPCGIVILYPTDLDYYFALGEFKEVIKTLNDQVSETLNNKRNSKE